MVRIVQEENQTQAAAKPEPKLPELGYRHHVLLNAMGLVVAQAPEKVLQLLADYGIELSRENPEEELADTLILAISECDRDFNRDLASLILDMTLNSSYDEYDFRQLAGQAANILSTAGKNQNNGGEKAPGLLGSLVSTIGQIGGILSNQAGQSESAGQKTREGINAYRRSQAEQQELEEKKKNNMMLFLLLMGLGIGILGFMAYLKRQAQPKIKTP